MTPEERRAVGDLLDRVAELERWAEALEDWEDRNEARCAGVRTDLSVSGR